jgi:AcrR family transcriptional regulator
MPRLPDPNLNERLLDGAQKIWDRYGESALTMRAVAKEAKTTTPTLYERFPDKKALLIALRNRSVLIFDSYLSKASGPNDFFSRYIEFAERNPHQYDLLFGHGWKGRRNNEPIPQPVATLQKMLSLHGRRPIVQVRRQAFGIWSLLHGTSMLRIAVEKAGKNWPEVKSACLEGCAILMSSKL